MERNVELGMMLSYYGAFLTDRQREMLQMHVDEDLSLGEIAEREGISRQGVHDTIRRGVAQMEEMERKLRHVARVTALGKGLAELREYAAGLSIREAEQCSLIQKIDELIQSWENSYGV